MTHIMKWILAIGILGILLGGCTSPANPEGAGANVGDTTGGTAGTGTPAGSGTEAPVTGVSAGAADLPSEIDVGELDQLTEELDQVSNIGGALQVGDQIQNTSQLAAGSAAGAVQSGAQQELPSGGTSPFGGTGPPSGGPSGGIGPQ